MPGNYKKIDPDEKTIRRRLGIRQKDDLYLHMNIKLDELHVMHGKYAMLKSRRDRADREEKVASKYLTVTTVAKWAGVHKNTVFNDIKRELISPCGVETINSVRRMVFTRHEAEKYRDFKKINTRINRRADIARVANAYSVVAAASHFNIKPDSVRQAIRRWHKEVADAI